MKNDTIGIIETRGLLDAFVVADAISKGTRARLIGRHMLGDGLVTLIIKGRKDVVRSALEIAEASAAYTRSFLTRKQMLFEEEDWSCEDDPENFKAEEERVDLFTREQDRTIEQPLSVPERAHVIEEKGKFLRAPEKTGKMSKAREIMLRREKMASYISSNMEKDIKTGINDLEKEFSGISRATIRLDLKELMDKGIVKKIGRTSGAYYIIADMKMEGTETNDFKEKVKKGIKANIKGKKAWRIDKKSLKIPKKQEKAKKSTTDSQIIHSKKKLRSSERKERMLDYIVSQCNAGEKVSITDLEIIFTDVTRRTLQLDLQHLKKKGRIIKKGQTRACHWVPKN